MKSFVIPHVIQKFAARFHENGFQLYIVGGAVRDFYIGKRVVDYDFATDARPEAVRLLFPRTIPTGIAHGTVTVIFSGEHFEVTTFRSDGNYSDSRHPDSVHFAPSIGEDLGRRDFTVNALAVDTLDGRIIDNFNGMRDIRDRIIRAIGKPADRFQEDSLRMLRAFRLSVQHHFTIEEGTLSGIRETSRGILRISSERIREELNKILTAEVPSSALFQMEEIGILRLLLPELTACRDIGDKGPHSIDTFTHLCRTCDYAPQGNIVLRWASLLHDIGKPVTETVEEDGRKQYHNHDRVSAELADDILTRLKFPNSQRRAVTHIIRHHMFNYTSEWSDAAVRRFIHRIGIEHLADVIALRIADIQGSMLYEHITDPRLMQLKERVTAIIEESQAVTVKDLRINGSDLIALGIPGGPAIGTLLGLLLEAVLEDQNLNVREKLLEMAAEMYRSYHLD